jgi:hypothetical protein
MINVNGTTIKEMFIILGALSQNQICLPFTLASSPLQYYRTPIKHLGAPTHNERQSIRLKKYKMIDD